MSGAVMEGDTMNSKVDFIILQTVKKDPFEPEADIPVILHSTDPISLPETNNLISENTFQNSVPLISSNADQINENCAEGAIHEKQLEGNHHNEHENDASVKEPPSAAEVTKNKNSKTKRSKMKNNKKAKHKTWPTNNKTLRAKILKKKKKRPANSSKSAKPEEARGSKPKCEYPRLCSGCGHAYKTKQSFWNHKQRCAMLPQNNIRNIAVDENGMLIVGEGNNGYVRRKEYICAHCERRYRKKYNLQEHLKNTCRGKPCSKGRLQCWEEGCTQAFYKYVDLVQHVTMQHGQDLQIQKLQFPNLNAFNTWKTEESNSKFMYARKITGSKRFSNTKYHYFVCQFNHRNEKKNSNRKTNRRKSTNLVVPNYNCPSRIMVKECENQIQVTYISSHNHELNLSNVIYQPLEKETRSYIKTLLQLGVSAKKVKEHLQEGVGNPEIDSFLATKQHFLTLNRIKRMESKLKAKNRARHAETESQDKKESFTHNSNNGDVPFLASVDMNDSIPTSSSCIQDPAQSNKNSDDVIRSIETNLKKLKGYMHKNNIKEKLSDRISKMIQELCDECEHVDGDEVKPTQRKPKSQNTTRKRKTVAVATPNLTAVTTAAAPTLATTVPIQPPIAVHQQQQIPTQMQHQIQPIIVQHQQPIQSHFILQQPITIVDQSRIMTNVIIENDKSFTAPIHDNTDVLKPIYQPFNVNLLCLKSIDPYIPEREQILLSRMEEQFSTGYLCDAVVNSFLDLVCQPMSNVITANTGVTEFVQLNQKVPDVWHCYNWNDIDTLFIPCNPSKKQWFLLVLLVKNNELQILDPTSSYETMPIIYKKYENSIQCWYSVLHNFLGISHCNVTFPTHTRNNDAVNSGVLICWYVFQYINKRNLHDNIDTDIFRKYIYNTIVSNSSPVLMDVQEVQGVQGVQ